MTTAVDHRLRTEFNISLTDFQILKVLQLSDTGTWLLSRVSTRRPGDSAGFTSASPGLSPAQTRSSTATIARVRADAGDVDRAYGSAPDGIG